MPKSETNLCPLPYATWLPKIIKRKLGGISGKSNILDIGCGSGAFLFAILSYLKKRGVEVDAAAFDTSVKSIELAKKIFPFKNAEFFVADADAKNQQYEKICELLLMSHVWEHVADRKKLLENISLAMDANSVLYVATILKKPYAVWLYRRNGEFFLDPTHLIEYKQPEDFFSEIEKNGYEIIKKDISQFSLPLIMLFEKIFLSLGLFGEEQILSLQLKSRIYKFFQKIRIPVIGFKTIHILAKKKNPDQP